MSGTNAERLARVILITQSGNMMAEFYEMEASTPWRQVLAAADAILAAGFGDVAQAQAEAIAKHSQTVMDVQKEAIIRGFAENRMLGGADALDRLADMMPLPVEVDAQMLREIAAEYRKPLS